MLVHAHALLVFLALGPLVSAVYPRIVDEDPLIAINSKAHNTEMYRVEDPNATTAAPILVVRHGKSFLIKLKLNASLGPLDQIQWSQWTQKKELVQTWSLTTTPIVEQNNFNGGLYQAYLENSADGGHELTYRLSLPFGSWFGSIWIYACFCTTTTAGVPCTARPKTTYSLKTYVAAVSDPLNPASPTYMADPAERNEYVFRESGRIWTSNSAFQGGRPWAFNQFSRTTIMATLKVLDRMLDKYRGDVARVARHLSWGANNFVLWGRWDGKYEDGKEPGYWTGSQDIFMQYLETGNMVKYGQCWVFSGITTSMSRMLGIGTRSVTNFDSAHEGKPFDFFVDHYYDADGKETEGPPGVGSDSSWNFHVWNEGWFTRTTADKKHDGWQAYDGTAQEESEGRYQCGPAPKVAIFNKEDTVDWDVAFIRSETSCGTREWEQVDSKWVVTREIKDSSAAAIYTKRIDSDVGEDIKYTYKGKPCYVPWGTPTRATKGTCTGTIPHNASCSVDCGPGYSPNPPTRNCNNGVLDAQQTCKYSTCKALNATVANGALGTCGSNFLDGQSCNITCNSGFSVSGKPPLCVGGNVIGGLPTCVKDPIPCPALSNAPSDGSLDTCGAQIAHQASCSIACSLGYTVRGAAYNCNNGDLQGAQSCVKAAVTKKGCYCQDTWVFEKIEYKACSAKNPDNDPKGTWCFTIGKCNGEDWDYCDSTQKLPSMTGFEVAGPKQVILGDKITAEFTFFSSANTSVKVNATVELTDYTGAFAIPVPNLTSRFSMVSTTALGPGSLSGLYRLTVDTSALGPLLKDGKEFLRLSGKAGNEVERDRFATLKTQVVLPKPVITLSKAEYTVGDAFTLVVKFTNPLKTPLTSTVVSCSLSGHPPMPTQTLASVAANGELSLSFSGTTSVVGRSSAICTVTASQLPSTNNAVEMVIQKKPDCPAITSTVANGGTGTCNVPVPDSESCSYKCNDNFILTGDTALVCVNGALMGKQECKPVDMSCMMETAVENGRPGTCGVKVPPSSTCSIACNDAFMVEGDDHLTCGSSKTFIGVQKCVPKPPESCPVAIKPPIFGDVGTCVGTLRHGETCKIVCQDGYRVQGDPQTCNNGVMEGESQVCEREVLCVGNCNSNQFCTMFNGSPDLFQTCTPQGDNAAKEEMTAVNTSKTLKVGNSSVTLSAYCDKALLSRFLCARSLKTCTDEYTPAPVCRQDCLTVVRSCVTDADWPKATEGLCAQASETCSPLKYNTAFKCARATAMTAQFAARGKVITQNCPDQGALGDRCEFSCDRTYSAHAPASDMVCTPVANGAQYVGTTPTCLLKSCFTSKFPLRNNSWQLPGGVSLGSCGALVMSGKVSESHNFTCQLACADGFELSPPGNYRCNGDQWISPAGEIQRCVPKPCAPLAPSFNLPTSDLGTCAKQVAHKGFCSLTCPTGKVPNAPSPRCLFGHLWYPLRLKCVVPAQNCTAPATPRNAKAGKCVGTLKDGSECDFECNAGYTLNPNVQSRIACQNGTVVVPVVQQGISLTDYCVPAFCSPLQNDPPNGQKGSCGFNVEVNQTCAIECNVNYKLTPSSNPALSCDSSTGQLQGIMECAEDKEKPCAPIADVVNGTKGTCGKSISHNTACTILCEEGFTVKGTPAQCNNGVLTTPQTCAAQVLRSCDGLDPSALPQDATIGTCGASLAHDASCQIACAAGTQLTGSLTCADGKLLGAQTCEPVACTALTAAPANGATGTCGTSVPHGQKCDVDCNNGYSLKGPSRTCNRGQLLGDAQTCEKETSCAALPTNLLPEHGTSGGCGKTVAENSVCQIACESGYIPEGADYRCVSGTLVGAMSCNPKPCPGLNAKPVNGELGTCGTPVRQGEDCTIRCAAGFKVTGPARKCPVGATALDGQDQTCTAYTSKECPPANETPEGGNLGTCGSATDDGKTCTFGCDVGYTLQGVARTCVEGVLVGTAQTCKKDDTPVVSPTSAPEPNPTPQVNLNAAPSLAASSLLYVLVGLWALLGGLASSM